jgi:hypothetical protein
LTKACFFKHSKKAIGKFIKNHIDAPKARVYNILKNKTGEESMDYIKKGGGSWIVDQKPVYGDLILTADKIIFNKKNAITAALFGVIGYLLSKGKTVLEINIDDIKNVRAGSFKKAKNVLQIDLKDGSAQSFVVGPIDKWFDVFKNIIQRVEIIK